jgi:hypothetical protein
MKATRRQFLGLFEAGAEAPAARDVASPASRSASEEHCDASPGDGRFSLEQFYSQRGPQTAPPIVFRPTTLCYDIETTSVGSGPAADESGPAADESEPEE